MSSQAIRPQKDGFKVLTDNVKTEKKNVGPVRWLRDLKCLLCKPDDLNPVPGSILWKERKEPWKLTSDAHTWAMLYVCTHICTHVCAHTHTHTESNEKLKQNKGYKIRMYKQNFHGNNNKVCYLDCYVVCLTEIECLFKLVHIAPLRSEYISLKNQNREKEKPNCLWTNVIFFLCFCLLAFWMLWLVKCL